MEGRAFFDISEKGNSINLNLDDVHANAKGALFNLQKYEDEKRIVADVEKGSLSVSIKDDRHTIGQGKRFIYDEETQTTTIITADAFASDWRKGQISFDNTPLDEVFVAIEKFYGVDIDVIDDSAVTGHHLTATDFKPENLNDCLELVASIVDMNISRKGKSIEISNIKAN